VHGAGIIERVAAGPGAGRGFLTDGEHRCAYRDLAGAIADVAARLEGAGVRRSDGVVLECANTLPGALALLCLLEGGYRCVLWPQAQQSLETPPFCRYRVRASADAGPAPLRLHLQVAEHGGWNGRPNGAEAYLYLRTSGSTSGPRLAAHAPGALIGNATDCVARFGLEAGDRVAIPVPIFHMYGLGAAFLPALLAGATIDLQPGAQVLRYLAREQDFAPTVAYLTPSFCEALLAARKSPRPYRATITAGDVLTEELFARYEARHGPLLNLYGCTELGAIAACAASDPRELRGTTAGRLMPHARLCESPRVDDDLRELRFRHDHGFAGYAGEDGEPTPESGARSAAGFATHDLGRMLGNGCLQVLGRSDHHVNRDGRLVALTDIETALQCIDGIAQAAVVARGRTRRGQALTAVCVPSAPGRHDPRGLRRACLELLPKHAIPDAFVLVPELPRLASGKIDRVRLGERFAPGAAPASPGATDAAP
jgi:acyl-coenzyme A synthetase/AMP-(fatty) acid ligase